MMNLRARLLAYSLLAGAAFTLSPEAMSAETRLSYLSYPADSGKIAEYWDDMADLAKQYGELPTEVFVAEFQAEDGPLTVTMLGAMGACGLNECPIRIFKDGRLIADLNGCSAKDEHAMNPAGTLLMACDDVIPVAR